MRKWLNQLRRHLGCRLRWAHWTVCLIAVLTSQGRGNCGVSGPLESIWDFLRHIMQRMDHHCRCQLQCFQQAGIILNSPMKNQSHDAACSHITLDNIIIIRVHSVLLHCWLGVRKSIRPVKIEWWGVGVVICLERGTDCLHMVQLMPLHPYHLLPYLNPDWFYLLVSAYPDCPGKEDVKRV